MQALLICLTAGLIWQFVLVAILIRRELGGLEWSRVRNALWLRAPGIRRPAAWVEGLAVGVALRGALRLEGALALPGPSARDFADFLDSDRGEEFFSGAWGWYAVVALLVVFNTVLGEELLFRGFCCRECRVSLEGATTSPTGCCSRPTTCTRRG